MTEVIIAPDAIERLTAAVTEPAMVVSDANTHEAAGARVTAALGDAREFVFPQRSGLEAGMEEVTQVRDALRHRPQLVAVGSGVITDIVRYAAHLADRDFVSVPTAASMDGYASSVAAMQIDGVKVTYPAIAPTRIFADPRVAAAAPAELTRAGIGDLLAKATAGVDWLSSHLLYGEAFDESVAARVNQSLIFVARNVEALLAGGEEATGQLLDGLVQSGIAMAIVGSSRPASGCEHHASHLWDLLAAQGRRPHGSHGLQVGFATRYAMRLQRFAYGPGAPVPDRPDPVLDPLGPAARAWLGEPTKEIVEAVEQKRRYAAAPGEDWPRDESAWAQTQARLVPALERFDQVERALALAEIPPDPAFVNIDAETLGATFRYASRLRARYTVIDFLEGQGALDDALAAALR